MLENMVELVGLEPTTSSLRTMRSARKPQFGVHLAADYGSKRSNSDRLAGSCLRISSAVLQFRANEARCAGNMLLPSRFGTEHNARRE